MGCVYRPSKGKNKKKSGVWWIKYVRDRKAYYESSNSTTKQDAIDLLKLREGDIVKGVPITPQVGRLTLAEAADDLLAYYRTKGRRSIDEAERRIRLHLRPYFSGERRMATITSADVTRYTTKRQADTIVVQRERTIRTRKGMKQLPEIRKAVSNGEINRELAILRRIFSIAIKNGKLLNKPSIELLPEAAPRQGFFDAQQIEEVCHHLSDEIAAVVRFAFITGWRVDSEVLKLEWSRVDFTGRGSVRLIQGTTKNGEARRFIMTNELRKLLETRRVEHDRLKTKGRIVPLVFHREARVMQQDGTWKRVEGQRIKSFIKAWRTACLAAGYPGRIPHDLRRSAVRTFVRAGIGEHVAMALSGHKTPSVFRRYDIVDETDLDVAATQLDTIAIDVSPKRRAT